MKLNPDIFVAAAELVFCKREHYSCFAIDSCHNGPARPSRDLAGWSGRPMAELSFYEQLFQCATQTFVGKYAESVNLDILNSREFAEIQEIRILALLFAAQEAKYHNRRIRARSRAAGEI